MKSLLLCILLFTFCNKIAAQKIEIKCDIKKNKLTQESYKILDSIIQLVRKDSTASLFVGTYYSDKPNSQKTKNRTKLDFTIGKYLRKENIRFIYVFDLYYFYNELPFVEIRSSTTVHPPIPVPPNFPHLR